MSPDVVLQIARGGSIVDNIALSDVPGALKSGRLLSSDHYLDPESNAWRPVSNLCPSVVPGSVSKSTKPKVGDFELLLIVLGGVFVALSIWYSLRPGATNPPANATGSAAVSTGSAAERLRRADLKVDALLPKFVATTDKFDGITWYKHVERPALRERFMASPPSAFLEVDVNSSGARYLVSNYISDRALRYHFVLFIIDGVKQEGTRSPPSEDRSVDYTESGFFVERVYHLIEEDRKFVSVLAAAARAGKPVSCRLKNFDTNRVFDWDPTPDELRVLAESVELADALRERRLAAVEAGVKR